MSLSFNEKTNDFFVLTDDKKTAQEVGLTLSTSTRGPKGEFVYFSKDSYAALAYWREADAKAKARLGTLYDDYAASWATEHYEKFPVGQPDSIQREMGTRPYQDAGVAYALARHNTLIGDDMGVGKTLTSIAIANATGAEKILVVCPATIRLNWRREIKKWSTIPQVRTFTINRGSDGVARWPHYTVISYELCRNPAIHQALRDQKWDLLIIDEAHYLKSHTAQRTHALFGGGRREEIKHSLAERASKVVCLTGTPLLNRPRECFTLAKALCHESIDWMGYDDFCYRYNPSMRASNGHSMEAKGRLPELRARLRCNFMIRRLKKDILKDLPEKQYEFAYIDPDGAISECLRNERMLDFDPARDLKSPDNPIWGEIATVRREMGEAKLPRVVEHVKYLLEVEELDKVVVFFHHRGVMDRFADAMHKFGVVQVRGGMGSIAKQNNIDAFCKDRNIRIFIGQLDAAGFGVDGLQNVASRVVFAEPAWTPGVNEQAVDRLHRIGQQFPVIAQFLIVEGSLDERILGLVLEKNEIIHEALDAGGASQSIAA